MQQAGLWYLLSLSASFISFAWAKIQFVVPSTPLLVNVPVNISWTREDSDPLQFVIHNVVTGQPGGFRPEDFKTVNSKGKNQGSVPMTFDLAGPHTLTALKPRPKKGNDDDGKNNKGRVLGVSENFQVEESQPSSPSPSSSTNIVSSTTTVISSITTLFSSSTVVVSSSTVGATNTIASSSTGVTTSTVASSITGVTTSTLASSITEVTTSALASSSTEAATGSSSAVVAIASFSTVVVTSPVVSSSTIVATSTTVVTNTTALPLTVDDQQITAADDSAPTSTSALQTTIFLPSPSAASTSVDATPSSSTAPAASDHAASSGMSRAAVVGIAIGTLILILVITALVMVSLRRRRERKLRPSFVQARMVNSLGQDDEIFHRNTPYNTRDIESGYGGPRPDHPYGNTRFPGYTEEHKEPFDNEGPTLAFVPLTNRQMELEERIIEWQGKLIGADRNTVKSVLAKIESLKQLQESDWAKGRTDEVPAGLL